MVAVHDGTANINIRNMNNVKCVNCENCIGTEYVDKKLYYVCLIAREFEYVEECVANDENLGCDMYVEDRNDDTTA